MLEPMRDKVDSSLKCPFSSLFLFSTAAAAAAGSRVPLIVTLCFGSLMKSTLT